MPLPPLRPDDPLGRAEYGRSRAKRWRKGHKDHQTFLVRREDENISVDRLGHTTDDEIAQIQEQLAARREASGFYGWAVLPVREANRSGRNVRPCPVRQHHINNPYHAVIELNLTADAHRREQQKKHATELSAVAEWKQNPR